jgi:segregation and condensation protein B
MSESDAAAEAATAADAARAAELAAAAEAAVSAARAQVETDETDQPVADEGSADEIEATDPAAGEPGGAADEAEALEAEAIEDEAGEVAANEAEELVEEAADEAAEAVAARLAEGGSEPTADPVEDDADDLDADQMVLTDPAELDAAVEAILFVVDAPIDAPALAATLRVPVPDVTAALDRLRAGYDERGAGIELRDAAGGVRLYTRPSVAPHVERFLQDGQRSRLSQAALETLAVIAYRQPVTRSRVSAIRGVNVDGVVRTLLSRGLIVEVGSDPESGAGLFRTSELFLERMGMQSLDELPSLAPLLPELSGLEHEEL